MAPELGTLGAQHLGPVGHSLRPRHHELQLHGHCDADESPPHCRTYQVLPCFQVARHIVTICYNMLQYLTICYNMLQYVTITILVGMVVVVIVVIVNRLANDCR